MDSVAIKEAGRKSVKWSFFAEIISKISLPISTMILARLLMPEIFGITTAVTMIVSFCEVVLESGFAKYLIEHDFVDENDYKKKFTLLFYLSIFTSLLTTALIIIFRYPLSSWVGNAGYEIVLVGSSAQIIFASLNALFSADLKRQFKFNKLFLVKIIYCLIPFVVTVPLALFGFGYWSLIIGACAAQIFQLPLLIILARRKLSLKFNILSIFGVLRDSLPMILDSVVVWLCSWIVTFLATQFYDSTTVGLIKVANSTINSIFLIFSASFTSVLFPTLSRLKNNESDYKDFFIKTQKAAMCLLPPIGVGCYFFSRVITAFFLGSNWMDASFMIGIFGLTKPLLICYNNFLGEAFRSKGYFYKSIFYQIFILSLDLVLRLTIGRISLTAYIWMSVVSDIIVVVTAIIILRLLFGLSILKEISAILPSLLCCGLFLPVVFLSRTYNVSFLVSVVQIFVCGSLYFLFYFILYKKNFVNMLSYFKFEKRK